MAVLDDMLKDVSIKYLPEFITLAEIGNYAEAAEELFTSQSSLSKHIQALEREVGHTLLLRTGRTLIPTPFGELLLDYARRFVDLDREYQAAAADFESRTRTDVHIAVSPNMNCDHMVNMLWDHFIEKHPACHLFTGEFHTYRTLEQIFAMGYELAFRVSDTPAHEDYCCYPWAASSIVALLPTNHPLAQAGSIQLDALREDPFVLPSGSSALQAIVLNLCAAAGFQPKAGMYIHGGRNLVEMVRGGVGVGLAPASDVAAASEQEVVALELQPAATIYLNLYYQKDKPLSKAAKAFLDYAIHIHQTHDRDIPFMGPEVPVENIFFE